MSTFTTKKILIAAGSTLVLAGIAYIASIPAHHHRHYFSFAKSDVVQAINVERGSLPPVEEDPYLDGKAQETADEAEALETIDSSNAPRELRNFNTLNYGALPNFRTISIIGQEKITGIVGVFSQPDVVEIIQNKQWEHVGVGVSRSKEGTPYLFVVLFASS